MTVGKRERERRWGALRGVMSDLDIDAVILRGSADTPHLLYFADLLLRGMPNSVFAMTAEGDVRLFALNPYSFGEPIPIYADDPAALVERESDIRHLVPPGVAPWLAERAVERLGIPGIELIPARVLAALKQALPGVELLEVGPQLDELRLIKSKREIELIRHSAASADKAWEAAHGLIREGRSVTQMLADMEHVLTDDGCDRPSHNYPGSFLTALPFTLPLSVWDDHRPMKRGAAFNLEISPRYHGYFTQLTSPVSIGPIDPKIRHAYEAVLEAREASLAFVRPGLESKLASDAMVAALAKRGYEPVNPNIGHLCGFILDEVRVGAAPFTFQSGMTIVLHPIVKGPGFQMLMRGDTYLITPDGLEQLTHFPTDILEI